MRNCISTVLRATWTGLALASTGAAAQATAPFDWVRGEVAHRLEERAAILIPVQAGATTCAMQLDTGVAVSVLYADRLPREFGSAEHVISINAGTDAPLRRQAVAFARMDTGADEAARCGPQNEGALIGTLGNDVFRSGSLTLDLGNATFTTAAPIPEREQGTLALVADTPALRDLPVVRVTDSAGISRTMLVDTGSAPAAAILYHLQDWLAVTGRRDLPQSGFEIVRWGKKAICYQAPAVITLSARVIHVGTGEVMTYCDLGAEAATADNPVVGILGLRTLYGSTITFDFAGGALRVTPSAAGKTKSPP